MHGRETAALPASLRRANQRKLISLLQRLGSASKADLAKAAGMSQPTAGKIIIEMARSGVLERTGLNPGAESASSSPRKLRPGRPGQLVRLNRSQPRFLAIETGVDKTRVAVLPVAARLEDEWTSSFQTALSVERWIRDVRQAVASVPKKKLWGALVSIPGVVDERQAKVLLSPNLHWLENKDLRQIIGSNLNLPVLLVQEIRALSLGQLAATPEEENFLLVDFGMGVGGAVVRSGKLDPSPLPTGGEIGHTPVEGNSRPCGCGSVGCLETLVSQRALLKTFADTHGIKDASWPKLVLHVERHGLEPWLTSLLITAAKVFAGALNVLGLRRVIITGSLTELPSEVMELMESKVRRYTLWARFGKVTCEGAPRRRTAGLVMSALDRLVLPSNQKEGMILQTESPNISL